MRIGEIDIPDAEVEKLAPSKKRVLYCLYEAYPWAVTTWTLCRAGGTGFSARVKSLNDGWLRKYGLMIRNQEYMVREGRNVWAYWLQPIDELPLLPKQVHGDV